MAGDSTYDVWFPRDYYLADSIPYIRPLNDLPYVNLSRRLVVPERVERLCLRRQAVLRDERFLALNDRKSRRTGVQQGYVREYRR